MPSKVLGFKFALISVIVKPAKEVLFQILNFKIFIRILLVILFSKKTK